MIPVLMISPFSLYLTYFFCFFVSFAASPSFATVFAIAAVPSISTAIAEVRILFMVLVLYVSGLSEVLYDRLEFLV